MALHQRGQVVIINKLLLVSDLFKLIKDRPHFGGVHFEAEMFQASCHRRSAAVLGEWQFGFAPAHMLGVHDLVRFALLQDPVLMNAAGMCKRILAHNRLTTLHA